MSARTARRTASCVLAAATVLVVVAACSAPRGEAPSARTTAASSDAAAPAATTAAGSPGATSSDVPAQSDPSAGASREPTLASREFTVTGTYVQVPVRMRLDIVELRRRGELLDLTANLTNLAQDGSQDLRWQVASRFAGPYRKDINGTDGVFSGAVLTDVAGKKRYLVAADSGGACVCTVQLSSTFVGAGQSIELSATYAAPPTTTTKLDAAVTSLGTFRDLPIS